MNILILSTDYTGIILYKQLEKEGNTCYLINPYHKHNGIQTIPSISLAITKNLALGIVCSSELSGLLGILKAKQVPLLCASQLSMKLELDQKVLIQFCKTYGLRLLKDTTKVIGPLSSEIWFSAGEPLYQYFGYIKQDKFLAGDMGPDVDGESVLFWGYENRNIEPINRLFNNGLFDFLKSIKYTGPFAIDAMISEDDLYPYITKIVPRFRASSLIGLLSLIDIPLSEIINHLVAGEKLSILTKDAFSVSVKISEFPYPYVPHEGLVKYITDTDKDWVEARRKLKTQVKDLDKNKVQFRIDGGMQGDYYEKFRAISYLN